VLLRVPDAILAGNIGKVREGVQNKQEAIQNNDSRQAGQKPSHHQCLSGRYGSCFCGDATASPVNRFRNRLQNPAAANHSDPTRAFFKSSPQFFSERMFAHGAHVVLVTA
jgi:hypothetical protein